MILPLNFFYILEFKQQKMSLKAYDGMVTYSGFSYLQKNIKETLPLLKEASLNKLGKELAELILENDIVSDIRIEARTNLEISQLENITKTKAIEYIRAAGKILSKSEYSNIFTVLLCINIEQQGDKLLVYPGINVEEHRNILLSFLNDYYAQDSTDADKNVSEKEWKQRVNDWYEFGYNPDMKIRVVLFEELFERLKTDELIDLILKHIPSKQERIYKKQKQMFLDTKITKPFTASKYSNVIEYMNTIGKEEFEKYCEGNPIQVFEIDKKYLEELEI